MTVHHSALQPERGSAIAPEISGKTILIFDDGLRSLQGHFFDYDKAVIDEHRRHGAQVTLICNAQFDRVAEIEANGATVLPIVKRSVWTGDAPTRRGPSELVSWLKQAFHFAAVLDRHLATRHYDLVFVPNAMVYDSLAWLLLWWKNGFRDTGRVVLFFRFALQYHPANLATNPFASSKLPKRIRMWKAIMRGLSVAASSGRVVYITDSLRLAKDYRSALELQLTTAPSPRALSALGIGPNARTPPPIIFALLGHSRWARGSDLFEKAIEQLLARGEADGLRFVIQRYSEVLNAQGEICNLSPIILASDHVEVIDKPLSTQDYEAMFARIDCMVLPYRREYYYAQISGVAIEAASAGIPMIYTADTWLEDFAMEQGAGIAVPDCDVEALAAALRAMAADYSAYKAQAVARSAVARERNSPEAFLRTLWGAADRPEPAA